MNATFKRNLTVSSFSSFWSRYFNLQNITEINSMVKLGFRGHYSQQSPINRQSHIQTRPVMNTYLTTLLFDHKTIWISVAEKKTVKKTARRHHLWLALSSLSWELQLKSAVRCSYSAICMYCAMIWHWHKIRINNRWNISPYAYLPTFESQKTEHAILQGSKATKPEGGKLPGGGGGGGGAGGVPLPR